MFLFKSLNWKNSYIIFYLASITGLEIAYVYLLIIYLKNKKGYKIHKLDIFTLFSTLVIFTTYLLQSYDENELFFINLINLYTKFSLNIILCCLLLVTVGRIFTEYIKLMNYAIAFCIIIIAFSLLDIIFNDVRSFISDNKGYYLKIFLCIIQLILGIITISSFIFVGFMKDAEDNLILMVNEEDIYISHLCASMIRRIKELNKTYLVVITLLFNSNMFNLFFMAIYGNDFISSQIAKDNGKLSNIDDNYDFGFDDFFIFTILVFVKDILPYFLLVITTLLLRWK